MTNQAIINNNWQVPPACECRVVETKSLCCFFETSDGELFAIKPRMKARFKATREAMEDVILYYYRDKIIKIDFFNKIDLDTKIELDFNNKIDKTLWDIASREVNALEELNSGGFCCQVQ